MKLSFLSLLLAAVIALGSPAPHCHDDLVHALKDRPHRATSFCSAFLHIPKKTITKHKTVTGTWPPVTIIRTKVETSTVVTTSVTTITNMRGPVTYYYNAPYPSVTKTVLPTPPAKREEDIEARNVPIPTFIPPRYRHKPTQISSACSCLHIPKSTVYKTITTTWEIQPYTTTTTRTHHTMTTSTTISTAELPRYTISMCYNYEDTPLNKGYEYLNDTQAAQLTKLNNVPIYDCQWVKCCNMCYETENCVAYRYNDDHSTCTCERWVTPLISDVGGLQRVGYNKQCKAGMVRGVRQQITEKDMFGHMRHPIGIGACMVANWED